MRELAEQGTRMAAADPAGAGLAGEGGRALVRRLIWLYFWLLIFEGALRKWLLPQWSGPLLIVRDPLVLVIYFLATRARLWEPSVHLALLKKLAVAGIFLVALQAIWLGVPLNVLGYGFRTYFLHVPLIFLMPAVFGGEELRRLGWWVLVLTAPMALLMAYQFQSAPSSWINRAPGEGGRQLLAAMDHVRPPGTFSFVTGPVNFFAMTAAFLLCAVRSGWKEYAGWVLVGGASGTMLGLAVSGSRSMLVGIGVVVIAWLLGMIAARQVRPRMVRTLMLAAIVLVVLAQVQLFREGAEVLTARWEMASASERGSGGMFGRVWETLWTPVAMLPHIPWLGAGLGVGTNVGASLLTGRPQFLLSEGEWGRVVWECGPLGGVLLVGFRVSLAVALARASLRCAAAGGILPMLLFSACAVNLVTGQIAQPTILGFTALGAGLCLAAVRAHERGEGRTVALGKRGPEYFTMPLRRRWESAPRAA